MEKLLQQAQEKLRAIDKLSNYAQKINEKEKKDNIAYLIHRICEADYIDIGLSQELLYWSIEANADMFMKAE